jgi:hypothetical protein
MTEPYRWNPLAHPVHNEQARNDAIARGEDVRMEDARQQGAAPVPTAHPLTRRGDGERG